MDKENQLNESNFQEEGEDEINQTPKYKYEIKIIHDTKKDKAKIKSKTPEKIISSTNFSIMKNQKKIVPRQNINIINNNIYQDTNNDDHYDNFNNYSNYNLYKSKSCIISKKEKKEKKYSNVRIPQAASQVNIYSKTTDNFYNPRNYTKKYMIIDENNQCICQKEFNEIIENYLRRGKNIKHNYYKINTENIRNNCNYNNKYNYRQNNNPKSYIKRQFKTPLKIEKSIEKSYTNLNIEDITPKKNDRAIDKNLYKNTNSKPYTKNLNKIIYNKNIYNKNKNNYLYIKNNNLKNSEKKADNKKNIPSNYSFISIDDSKNKSISDKNNISNKVKNTNKKKSRNKCRNDNSSILNNNNNQIMIHKSSERSENIKSIPIGQKIQPLVVKKTVQKPIIEKIRKEDGTTINVMKQTTVVTSIETKPIIDLKNKKSNNEILVKECTNSIYTTLTKYLDENDDKKLVKNKSFDDFNKNEKEKKDIFFKRKVLDKNMKNNNITQSQNLYNDFNNQNAIFNHKNNNINNDTKKNININISEISNDLLKHKNNNSSINNSSLISYEQIEPNNAIRINDEIKFIKYLYYRCTNLNSINKAKTQSLANYFLKLSDEEKIAILTNLNDGEPENKKIYTKLILILNEKRIEDENSSKKFENNFGDNFISDFEEEEDKKKENKQGNLLFKKKKVIK